jgi:hypothetical protein
LAPFRGDCRFRSTQSSKNSGGSDEHSAGYDHDDYQGAGWITFARIVLIFGGTLGVIDGLVAISKSSFYVNGAHFVFSDLTHGAGSS